MPGAPGRHHLTVLLCGEGCSTVLAVASLLDLGFTRATDVIGGMQAWLAAGLPTVPAGTCADHTLPASAQPGSETRGDRSI